jgi:hypothetical protein
MRHGTCRTNRKYPVASALFENAAKPRHSKTIDLAGLGARGNGNRYDSSIPTEGRNRICDLVNGITIAIHE